MFTDDELGRKIADSVMPNATPDLDAVRARAAQRTSQRRAVVVSVVAMLAVVATAIGVSGLGPTRGGVIEPAQQTTVSPTTTSSVSPSPVRPTPESPVSTSSLAYEDVIFPADSRQGAGFVSPTGNIVCEIDARFGVFCFVIEATYEPYACGDAYFAAEMWLKDKPIREKTNCTDEEHEQSVFFSSRLDGTKDFPQHTPARTWWWKTGGTTAQVTLWGSTNRHAALGYGESITVGDYTCRSAQTGMTCTNKAGRGFEISRTRLRAF